MTEGRTASHNTINVELAYTRAMLNWAVGQGLVAENKLAKVKKAKVVTRGQGALREEHLPLVLKATPYQIIRAFVVLAIDTGLRRFELLALVWKDIDFRTGIIRVIGKGTKAGEVIATKRALDMISALPKKRETDPVFMNPATGLAYTPVWINELVRVAIQDSGIEKHYGGKKIRIHALRHGHATNALEAGVPLNHVKAQLRHASIATTQKYVHDRMDKRLESMANKYEASLPGRRGPHRANHENDVQEEPRTISHVQTR